MRMYCTALLTITVFFASAININSQTKEKDKQLPIIYYVLVHSQGENWVDSLSFRKQPGIMEHVKYMSKFSENKKLVIGGPFLDDSGGMMVCNVETMEEAEQIAMDDPAVKSGILNVQVKKWYVAMSNITITP